MGNGKKETLAPICLFVYNRPEHTRRTLESLAANDLARQSELFIYADGPKSNATQSDLAKIGEVRAIIKEKNWCGKVEIVESQINKGLASSIISGVTEVVNKFGKIIVLEDDLVLSRGFLKYMNEALSLYENDERVMHVSGYMFPVKEKLPETLFINLTSCWGWATWQRAWQYFEPNAQKLIEQIKPADISRFNLDDGYDYYKMLQDNVTGKLKTWAVRWYASFFLKNGYSLHPGVSLVRNIGHDCSGDHCGRHNVYLEQKIADEVKVARIDVDESQPARDCVKEFFVSLIKVSVKQRLVGFLKKPGQFTRKVLRKIF